MNVDDIVVRWCGIARKVGHEEDEKRDENETREKQTVESRYRNEQYVSARLGDTLLDVALDNGLDVPHECGGNCACTTCHVVVEDGGEHLSIPEDVERDRLSTSESYTTTSRLACQAIIVEAEGGGAIVVRLVGEAV